MNTKRVPRSIPQTQQHLFLRIILTFKPPPGTPSPLPQRLLNKVLYGEVPLLENNVIVLYSNKVRSVRSIKIIDNLTIP